MTTASASATKTWQSASVFDAHPVSLFQPSLQPNPLATFASVLDLHPERQLVIVTVTVEVVVGSVTTVTRRYGRRPNRRRRWV